MNRQSTHKKEETNNREDLAEEVNKKIMWSVLAWKAPDLSRGVTAKGQERWERFGA